MCAAKICRERARESRFSKVGQRGAGWEREEGGRAPQQPRHICACHLMQRVSSETCLSPVSCPSSCGLIMTSSRSAISGSKQETIPFARLRGPFGVSLTILPANFVPGRQQTASAPAEGLRGARGKVPSQIPARESSRETSRGPRARSERCDKEFVKQRRAVPYLHKLLEGKFSSA